MNKIEILDCTLRDGGYCNQWNFGSDNIKKIISGLVDSDIEIIECGFLTNKINYNSNISKFTSLDQLSDIVPYNQKNKMFVVMMNYGEYDVDSLPECSNSPVNGIRLAFHKKDRYEAIKQCQVIKNKGYKVFVQAMLSLSYSDEEFIDMIRIVNDFKPYAFYIVDSFGMMKSNDLVRLFYLTEHNLDKEIWLGFHSHNNMQLAFSNAQMFTGIQSDRNLIVDSSVYGMGRGAGNLYTELFIQHLNSNFGKSYELKPILTIIDDIISCFYQENSWGYSLPNYLSAVHDAHPNYASFLDDKKTLTVEAMSEIFEMMDSEKKLEFDKSYIEDLYMKYMNTGKEIIVHKEELSQKLNGRKVLLIAPGRSSADEVEKIISFQSNDVAVISINFDYTEVSTDYISLSNLRRFRDLDIDKKKKCIVTSNIPADGVYYQIKYSQLRNNTEYVEDNAGLMAIKFLIDFGVTEVFLAGFDGYSHDAEENYAEHKMVQFTKNAMLDAMNSGMNEVLRQYQDKINITFLTKTRYVSL